MILGVGFDLFEVARMARGLEDGGDEFARQFLAPAEVEALARGPRAAQRCAAAFAAKEAVVKALSPEGGDTGTWKEIVVAHAVDGGGEARLEGRALARARALGAGRVRLTWARSGALVAAAALLETQT